LGRALAEGGCGTRGRDGGGLSSKKKEEKTAGSSWRGFTFFSSPVILFSEVRYAD